MVKEFTSSRFAFGKPPAAEGALLRQGEAISLFERDCFSRSSFAMTKSLLLLCLWLMSNQCMAQVDAFASVKLNRREVFPEQPIKATITVSTATWFTKPLDFDNIQVAKAFVLPFKRTQSTMRTINGKKYASLEFYFLIFPYETGDYQFPSLNIRLETPPIGDYKGQNVTVSTKAINFKVKEIPGSFEGKDWFIAKSVRLDETWNRPLNGLKVGDVIERKLIIRANGTLPNFIPELVFKELDFASVYPKTPVLTDRRSNTDANGIREETVVYLLENEGSYEVPPVRIEWWDPYRQQLFFKELPPKTLTIKDNPDLGMLRSLKDSLDLTSGGPVDEAEAEGPVMIWGLPWWQFVILLGIGLVALGVLVRITHRAAKEHLRRREAYRKSESYHFNQISKAQNNKDFFNRTFAWWDLFAREHGLNPSFQAVLVDRQEDELLQEWTNLESDLFLQRDESFPVNEMAGRLKTFRSRLIEEHRGMNHLVAQTQLVWE